MVSEENKLFVGNLDWDLTTSELESLFRKFGEILDVVVIKDRETGKSRGFGFVTFSNEFQCQNALKEMNGMDIKGRTMRVSLANPREVNTNGRQTYS